MGIATRRSRRGHGAAPAPRGRWQWAAPLGALMVAVSRVGRQRAGTPRAASAPQVRDWLC